MFSYTQLLGRVRGALKARGITLEDAVGHLGRDKSWLSSILTGKKNISLRAFLTLCQENQLDAAALLQSDPEAAQVLECWSRLDAPSRALALRALEGMAAHPPSHGGGRTRVG